MTIIDARANPSVVLPIGIPGPPGPPGPGSPAPDATDAADGEMIAALNGEWVIIPAPAGTGDMQSLIYDPLGKATNVFDLSNQTGVIDGGIFT